jgi:sulfur relay (sulfurtransferase) complex TusBCD TusD component (DsrE family)
MQQGVFTMKRIHLALAAAVLFGIMIGWLGSGAIGRTGAETASAQAQDETEAAPRGLLINLTTDDTWSANMAIGLAQRAVDQEVAPVIIFLNVRGVYLGDRERLPATEGNSEQNIHEKLQAFVAAGGQVIACPSCSQEAGLTQADYLEGVVVGEPGGIVPFLTDPNITVISY